MGLASARGAVRHFFQPDGNTVDRHRGALTGVLLTALCMLLWMVPAGLWDLRGADEARYVLVAREWLSGDGFITLTLLGEHYDQKPPLPFMLYALMLAISGGDVSTWAVRLPSVLLGTAGVLATWRIGRRHLGERAGLLSALVLMTSTQWMLDTPSAELNIMFSGWIVLSLACWLLRPGGALSWKRAAAMWLLLAAAFFTKGPLAIIVVVSVVAGECAARRSFAPLRESRLWQGLVLNGVLIGLWLWAQRIEAGSAFVENQVVGQTVDRFLKGDHDEPFWYYLPRIFTSIMFPWAILLVPAGIRMWRSRRNLPTFAKTALAGWIGVPFLVLTLAAGKRGMYMLPLLPAFAILVAGQLDYWLSHSTRRRKAVFRNASTVVALVAALAAAVLCAAGVVLLERPDFFWNHGFLLRRWQLAPMAALAAFLGWFAFWARAHRGRSDTSVAALFAILVAGGMAMFVLVRPALSDAKSTRSFAESLDEFIVQRGTGLAVGLLDRAAKPEYHVYGHYLGVPLERADLESESMDGLPDVLVAREDDWKDFEANVKRLEGAGYFRDRWIMASGDRLAVYVKGAEAPEAAATGEPLHFGLMGDTGNPGEESRNIASQASALHGRSPLAAVFLLGDNVYGREAFDAAIAERFDGRYAGLLADGVPFHAALGNHDVGGGYARSELVHDSLGMGGRRYFEVSFGDGLATFFVLDHYTLAASPDQIEWLKARLLACGSRWRFVVTHEPLVSSTDVHHLSEEHLALLAPVVGGDPGIHAVFSGHLHFHERPLGTGVPQVTNGAGSERDGPDVLPPAEASVVHDAQCSFLHLMVSESAAACEAIAEDGTVVDRFRIAPDGSGMTTLPISGTLGAAIKRATAQ